MLIITWTINNQREESARGTGFAMLQLIGQCGPLVGTRLYPDRDKPFYVKGMAVCALAMVGVAVLAGGLRWWLERCNRKNEGYGKLEEGEERGLVGRQGKEEEFRFLL